MKNGYYPKVTKNCSTQYTVNYSTLCGTVCRDTYSFLILFIFGVGQVEIFCYTKMGFLRQ